MTLLNQKQQKILSVLLKKSPLSSSQIHAELEQTKEKVSQVTVKRTLSEMTGVGFLNITGSGRSTAYSVSVPGRVLAEVDAEKYCSEEPDKRFGQMGYTFDLFQNFPKTVFDAQETAFLTSATEEYKKRIKGSSETLRKKELERLIIELSWKSSKIEGNTYTLLDTEKLILENKVAFGKTKDETHMILNHKDAFTFVREQKDRFKKIHRADIEELHKILVKNLGVGYNVRKKPVGVTGSVYRPLDNEFQISEALDALAGATARSSSPYDQALLAIIGLAYIQPFEDGNKRTGRLLGNAILMAHGLAPLSYRSVEEKEYREATLTFYELNTIVPFKKIFISQYDFAARNYATQ